MHPTAAGRRSQRGVTLIVALVMLVLITLVVVHSSNLSSSNLKSVYNMQIREEALAAANQAIERLISTSFTAAGALEYEVDINADGANDYKVALAAPVCIRAILTQAAKPSDVELGPALSAGGFWNTDWDIDATVVDVATGTSVRIREGVRVRLSQTDKDLVCS